MTVTAHNLEGSKLDMNAHFADAVTPPAIDLRGAFPNLIAQMDGLGVNATKGMDLNSDHTFG